MTGGKKKEIDYLHVAKLHDHEESFSVSSIKSATFYTHYTTFYPHLPFTVSILSSLSFKMDEQEPQVQAQQQKQQKQKPHQPPSGEPKAKSAKELKKEKRAAAVAARAISTDGGVPEGPPGAKQLSSTTNSDGRHSPAVHLNSSSQNPASSAGPSAPRRPPNLPEFSAPTLFAIQQNLFFSHLPHQTPADTVSALDTGKIHPIIIRVGVLMNSGQLRGANARTIGMMSAFKEVIRDYECPDQAVLWKDLPVYLSPMIAWLETCRPKGVGGGNAIRWLKSEINRLGEKGDKSEAEVLASFSLCYKVKADNM